MDDGAVLIGLAMLIASLPFLINPFQRRQPGHRHKILAKEDPAELREAALLALRDLDFDYRTGKVCDEDYPALRAGLLVKAALYIQEEQAADTEIEALINARKVIRSRIPASMQTRLIPSDACPSCGRKVHEADLYCISCGSSLMAWTETT